MIAIFDIDGTLAIIDHRLHWIQTKPKNWKAFYSAAHEDEVHLPIASIMKDLAFAQNTIVIATARNEKYRDDTAEWLQVNGLNVYDGLYMRKKKDFRPDYVVKSEMIGHITKRFGFPDIWFDDKEDVINELKKEGVFTIHVGRGVLETPVRAPNESQGNHGFLSDGSRELQAH